MKKKLTAVLIVFGLVIGNSAVFASVSFPDVEQHWSRSTVEWGTSIGMVQGYPDGTFKPDNPVTEAEFMALLIGAYHPPEVTDPSKIKHWADKYYNYAAARNYPVSGNNAAADRDVPLRRVNVAEIVVGAFGFNFSGDKAIQYLLGYDLASGKVGDEISIESYKGNDILTRAEAVQFIKNLKDKGLQQLKQRPAQPSSDNQLPRMPGKQLPKLIEIQKKAMDIILPGYPGYSVTQNKSESINFKNAAGKSTLSIIYSHYNNSINQIVLWNTNEELNFKLALDTLRMVGIAVEDSFEQTLKDTIQSGKSNTQVIQDKTIVINPGINSQLYISISSNP